MVLFHQIGNTLRRCCEQVPACECLPEDENSAILLPSPTEVQLPGTPEQPLHRTGLWVGIYLSIYLSIGGVVD